MALLALFGPEIRLHWRRGKWDVSRAGAPVRTARPREVSEIHCQGAIEITPAARTAALARGIPVVFLTADGRYRGRLEGPRGPSGALQLAQARWLADPELQLRVARRLVVGKLGTCRTLLLAQQRVRRDATIAAAACSLRTLAEQAEGANSIASARGYEGEAAARYFGVFGALLVSGTLSWSGRSKRPPRDPVNACLSYLYTLLAARVEDAIRSVGLLPGMGALHEPGPARLPLVYDLMEEFRAPLVDRLVLRLVNRRQLAPEDFEDPAWRRPSLAAPTGPAGAEPMFRGSGAVYLGASARRLLVREFSNTLRSDIGDLEDGARVRADWLLQRQARRIARVFQQREDQYRPFQWSAR